MCGIIGYIGDRKVEDVLLKGLSMLEYRGYDSAGIALLGTDNKVHVRKCTGKVQNLIDMCAHDNLPKSIMGMGHTRWATHGGVTNENAHPHKVGRVTLIHNGIIENYQQLRDKYNLGSKLSSQTDTEVVAALLDLFYEGDPVAAIRKTVQELKGTFGLGIIFADDSERLYAVRNVSPILAGMGKNGKEAFLASDVTAIAEYVGEYFVIPEHALAILTTDSIKVLDEKNQQMAVKFLTVDWKIDATGKNGYDYFMEKEIHEQPDVIRETILSRCKDGLPDFTVDQIPDDFWSKYDRISIIGCGTAMHAGLIAKSMLQSIVEIPTTVEIASEYIYDKPVVNDRTLAIIISQSGETIDTLEALRYARKRGAGNISIVNVKGSTIARESENVLYTNAGPEIAVASTKAYTTQVTALMLIVLKLAFMRGRLSINQVKEFMDDLLTVPETIKTVLERKTDIEKISDMVIDTKDAFLIGRGLDYLACLEGSLKLKEISYIHSEAYASGELKHGTIALITDNTPVIAVVTQQSVVSKEISNAIEVKARGAKVFAFVSKGLVAKDAPWAKEVIELPVLRDELMIFPVIVSLQLFAFYASKARGLDVDKPRNLAKVVTVE